MKFNSTFFFLSGVSMIIQFFVLSLAVVYFYSGWEVALEWEVYTAQGWGVSMLILFDFMSVMFLSTVLLISGSVMIYSSCYMSADKFSGRFGLLVLTFVVSMALLILSPNMVSLLLGWDGLGVTSYLLVCYYSSEKSFNASMLTALTNRLGDVAILITIALMASHSEYMYGLISSANVQVMGLVFSLVIVAAMTKSAQIPFSSWLPAAMAAPTPVSALVHSSTLVTAGVYLLIRFNYTIVMSGVSSFVMLLGLLTMLMAGGAAVMELDMKKVIALSTLSQLGVMFFSLGLGQTFLSFFHLISHAYFKAMLFMAAGAMIHSVKDYQDLRKMGSSPSNIMILSSVMFVSNMSLCGLPFLAGFYSKDLILEVFILKDVSFISMVVMMIATGLTVIYSVRFSIGLFGGVSKRESYSLEGDVSNTMLIGMSTLIFPSIAGGWWLSGLMSFSAMIWLPLWEKMMILVMILSLVGALFFEGTSFKPGSFSLKTLHQMWFMPVIFSPLSTVSGLKFGKQMFKVTDISWTIVTTWSWVTGLAKVGGYFNSMLRSALLSSFFVLLGLSLVL